jgi:hypothetical protein
VVLDRIIGQKRLNICARLLQERRERRVVSFQQTADGSLYRIGQPRKIGLAQDLFWRGGGGITEVKSEA